MRTPIMTALTVLAVALAGCSSGGGSESAAEPTDDADPFLSGNTTAGGSANATYGNTTVGANATAESNTTAQWQSENRSGEVSGVELQVNGPSAEEEFTVAVDTQEAYLNITIEGDDLDVSLRGPDCDEESCAESVDVRGGSGQVYLTVPAEGEYTLVLEPAGLGPVEAEYTVEFAAYVETQSVF